MIVVLIPALSGWLAATAMVARWPATPESVVFSFQTDFREITAYLPGDEDSLFDYHLTPEGYARINSSGVMELAYGRMVARGQGKTLADRLPAADGLSFEVTLTAGESQEANVFAWQDGNDAHFLLEQRGQDLAFTYRDTKGAAQELPLGRVTAGVPTHVVIVMDGAQAQAVVNGNAAEPSAMSETPWQQWKTGELVFGAGAPQQKGWSGTLEGFAIYDTALSPDQAKANGDAYQEFSRKRPSLETVRLRGELLAKSHVPSLEDIAPYRASLAVYEYRVQEVLEGEYSPEKVRAAHWVILDQNELDYGKIEAGHVTELTLQRFDANRQLKNVNLSDTLDLDFDLDLFFEIGGVARDYRP